MTLTKTTGLDLILIYQCTERIRDNNTHHNHGAHHQLAGDIFVQQKLEEHHSGRGAYFQDLIQAHAIHAEAHVRQHLRVCCVKCVLSV